jgi:hypothetical protein
MVADTHIPLTSGTVYLDHSHLVLEYATSDNEEPAPVQLSTRASVCVLCIVNLKNAFLNCDYSHLEACIITIQSQFIYIHKEAQMTRGRRK